MDCRADRRKPATCAALDGCKSGQVEMGPGGGGTATARAVDGPRQCVQSCRKGSVRPGPPVASQSEVYGRSSSAGGGAASADDGRVKGSCSESPVVHRTVAMAAGIDSDAPVVIRRRMRAALIYRGGMDSEGVRVRGQRG